MEEKGKMIIFSAPSGSGKSTLINYLMERLDCLEFSISATSRQPRGEEKDGVEYYFLTPEEFRAKIDRSEFLEWEEVYEDKYYGTLYSEIDRINQKGHVVVFDVDVVGGCNIKEQFGERAMSVFIQPPSVDVLRERLIKRGTDAMEVIEKRLSKASYELTFAEKFDKVVINDDLEEAKANIYQVVTEFLA